MAPIDDSSIWQKVQDALERHLLAQSNGEPLDLLTACEGDHALAAKVREVLDGGQQLLDGTLLEAAPEPIRQSFGDFDLLRPLGRGGMGTVYLARQRSLGRLVALKRIEHAALEQPATRLRMQREAELTALLDHPSIVPVYAVGEIDRIPFMAMKYLSGPSLAQVPRPQPPEAVARIGAALAKALDAAHTHGIVHRDVKPANVLLDGETPVLVDFGLARAQSDPTLTQEGKVAGTLRYMAPERLDAASPVADPRVDVYGLGATLYELLAARALFAEEAPTALVRAILSREPPPLRLRGRHHDLETIVLRALAKEPARRFPTAAAMADDLERYLAGQPVQSRRIGLGSRVLRQLQRHPRTAAVVTVLTAAAVLFLVVMLLTAARADADRQRRLDTARQDLDARRHQRAHDTLQLVVAAHPDDPEASTLLARAGAEIALDRLLVGVADRSANVAAGTIAGLQAVAGTSPARARVLALARTLATAHARGRAAGLQAHADLPLEVAGRRAAHALRAWLDGVPGDWQLPAPAADVEADEVVLTALLRRLAGQSPALLLAEFTALGPALRLQPRVRLLEAIAAIDRGALIEAERLLRGLCDDEAPPTVWRWLANVQLQLGQLPAAAASLEHTNGDTSPSADYFRMQHAYQTRATAGDQEGAARALDRWRQQPERSTEVERFLAEFDGKSDPARVDAVLATLETTLAAATDDVLIRDQTLATMIEIAAWHLPPVALGEQPADLAPHRRFLARWQERASGLRHGPAAAGAAAWLARSECACGGSSLLTGLERFAAACAACPLRVRPAFDYATAVANLPSDIEVAVRLHHAITARGVLDGIEAAVRNGDLVVATATRQLLRHHGWQLALHCHDFLAVVLRTPEVHDLLPDSMQGVANDADDYVRRLREQMQRR